MGLLLRNLFTTIACAIVVPIGCILSKNIFDGVWPGYEAKPAFDGMKYVSQADCISLPLLYILLSVRGGQAVLARDSSAGGRGSA